MPTKVFKVEHMHYMLVQNTWLGLDMHAGGCYMGVKIAFCTVVHLSPKAILGPPPAPPIKVSNANQCLQG